ncbi:MAG TPA: hypothetical protein VE130_06390 [Nitrososphaeraceae archaeon]|nr:hypothetical protein [Nitrososphaeraceae archaeon]
MSLEKIVAAIEAKGIEGIKKTELRREIQEAKELDSLLLELARSKEIYTEKKGNSTYYWHKNYYLQKLVSTDQKFSYLYTSMNSVRDSLNTQFDSCNTRLDIVTQQMREITEEIKVLERSMEQVIETNDLITKKRTQKTDININYDIFKEQFDQALSNASSSIGWVELCNLRKDICLKMNISREEFYHSFEEVVSNNFDKYELSTGGEEGIQLRGMVHGFVRCI